MMRIVPAGAVAFLLCIAVAAPARAQPRHAKKAASPTHAYEKPFPAGVTFNVSEMNGKAVEDPPSLTVDDTSRGTGYAGCNTFSAALYQIRGMRLAMGPIAMTHKTCPPARMALERAYLTILHSGPKWDIVGTDLVITGPTGSLRFRRGL